MILSVGMNPIQDITLNSYKNIKHGFFNGFDSNGNSLNTSIQVNSNAIENRRKIANYFNINLSNLIILNQKHTGIVHVISNDNMDKYKFSSIKSELDNVGDAIITNVPYLLIGVNTADCAPILLFDSKKNYIAAIHSGWKGTIGNIIENTLAKLIELKCRDVIAVIGPCVFKENLILEKRLIPQMYYEFIENINDDECHFDMIGAITNKLKRNKIIKNINCVNINTFDNKNFYSYRRSKQICDGRQFSGITLVN